MLAVELSSFQLHWSSTLAPQVGAILNLADDHLEWHLTFEAYTTAKLRDLALGRRRCGGVAIGNLDDPLVAAALAEVHRRARSGSRSADAEAGPARRRRRVLVDCVDWSGEPDRRRRCRLIEADR